MQIHPSEEFLSSGRKITDHWICDNRYHPGYTLIDHLSHQILNYLCP